MSDQAKVLDPKVLALAERIAEAQVKEMEKRKVELAVKYPHAITETLEFVPSVNKYRCRIKCIVTGDESRWVFTSDLFQVRTCEAVSKAVKAKAREVKKAELQEAIELIKARKQMEAKA